MLFSFELSPGGYWSGQDTALTLKGTDCLAGRQPSKDEWDSRDLCRERKAHREGIPPTLGRNGLPAGNSQVPKDKMKLTRWQASGDKCG